jgi:hypothetical protein
MKVLGLVDWNYSIHKQLVNYALSLFKQIPTEMIDLKINQELNLVEIKASKPNESNKLIDLINESSLLVISLNVENDSYQSILKMINQEQSDLTNKKPILLIITSSKNNDIRHIIDGIKNEIQENGVEVYETFVLPNYENNFENSEISNIRLRLDLIRKINRIMYNQLKIRDNSYFTCGIDPNRDYCGDAIEY